MRILDKHIGKTLGLAIGGVVLLLLVLQFFVLFVGEWVHIGNGDYNFLSAAEYVLLRLPYQIYNFFPMACLIGSLVGLGVLANQQELVIMRAAGVSVSRITWAVIKIALILIIIGLLIGEGLAPFLLHLAERNKTDAITQGQTLATAHGVWARSGNNFLRINAILPNEKLQGVTRYQFDKNQVLKQSDYASSAQYKFKKWQMENIKTSQINPNRIIVTKKKSAVWPLAIKPSVLAMVRIKPRELSLIQLFSYIKIQEGNATAAGRFVLSFWQRLFQPLATLIMVLLGVPMVFGSLRESSPGMRLIFGISLGFVYYFLNLFLGPLSLVWRIEPWVVALIPTVLFSLLAFILLRRAFV